MPVETGIQKGGAGGVDPRFRGDDKRGGEDAGASCHRRRSGLPSRSRGHRRMTMSANNARKTGPVRQRLELRRVPIGLALSLSILTILLAAIVLGAALSPHGAFE